MNIPAPPPSSGNSSPLSAAMGTRRASIQRSGGDFVQCSICRRYASGLHSHWEVGRRAVRSQLATTRCAGNSACEQGPVVGVILGISADAQASNDARASCLLTLAERSGQAKECFADLPPHLDHGCGSGHRPRPHVLGAILIVSGPIVVHPIRPPHDTGTRPAAVLGRRAPGKESACCTPPPNVTSAAWCSDPA